MTGHSRLRDVLTHASAVALFAGLLAAAAVPAQAVSRLPSERHWRKDVARVMAGSDAYVDRVTVDQSVRYAINLDIDNSTLASHYRPGTAVPAVLSFATYANQVHGVALLFNTARTGAELKHARALLAEAGYLVPEVCGRKSHQEKVAHGKQRCRARFIAEGYTIIANVGNHDTDFSGAHDYGRAFRLPNYHNRLT